MANSPFIIGKTIQDSPSYPVGTMMRKLPTKGDIGIEIEVEGNKFPKGSGGPKVPWKTELIPNMWSYHHDGSLRGEDNAEYVLTKPVAFSEAEGAIKKLWEMFSIAGCVLDESNRTSVHIHLNMQQFHLNRLTSFFALYFTVEELLTAWCGEHRIGNLFCLRAKDAPAIITQLKRFIASDGRVELGSNLHYSAMNANALQKFGSIEIRTLRGVSDPVIILDWIAILRRLYELSEEFVDPRNICAMFSSEGPMGFLDTVLGDKAHIIRSGIDYTNDQVRDSLYKGIRLAQDLCYCRDWGLFNPIDLKADPFGRDALKTAQIQAAQAQSLADAYNAVAPAGYQAAVSPTGQSILYTMATAPSPPLSPTQVYNYVVGNNPFQTAPAPAHDAPYDPDLDDDDYEPGQYDPEPDYDEEI